MKQPFEVVVIGGGHAGVEAAHAAARAGSRTALVTLSRHAIGVMSCNPAIGGVGKGHLVREIDALDGLMGRAADAAGIQFRLLNRSKGPAVRGPRVQTDRAVYRKTIQGFVAAQPGLEIVEGEVVDIYISGGCVRGVMLASGDSLACRSVVLTTGTFLRGVIHVGDSRQTGGRVGERAAVRLADRLRDLGLRMGRLKTGTPPRLDGRTIDRDVLERQPGDDDPVMCSFLSSVPALRQVPCFITHTNARTHEIIRRNLERSAMYGGAISSRGPRYCPSIEDKITRFADREAHQIFLEPEGLDDHTIYPNGISTSLPAEVQEEYVRSIKGLSAARIIQPGYAIEYDHVDPTQLSGTLELSQCSGFFLAGQINGTTGYEEAAAQGLWAGLNAALRARGADGRVLSRTQAYIGVMIDDLTTRGVTEPYRMFTSRAEYRLSLRADNADQRLTPLGEDCGIVGAARSEAFARKRARLEQARAILDGLSVTPREAVRAGINVRQDGHRRSGMALLALPEVNCATLDGLCPDLRGIDASTREQLEIEALYENYLDRQSREITAVRDEEGRSIPGDLDYDALSGLSAELREKLKTRRPSTIAQANRIEGMTPAALGRILLACRNGGMRRAG